jgi:hypothetical protein
MYPNQRCAHVHISDDSVMRDAMTKTRDLCISVLRAGSTMCFSCSVMKVVFFSVGFSTCLRNLFLPREASSFPVVFIYKVSLYKKN